MKGPVFKLWMAIILGGCTVSYVRPGDFIFSGAAGQDTPPGNPHDWYESRNWLLNGQKTSKVPGPSDNVTIGQNQGASPFGVLVSDAATVHDLTVANASTLSGSGDLTVNGELILQGGTIGSGGGSLTLNGDKHSIQYACTLARNTTNNGRIFLDRPPTGQTILFISNNVVLVNKKEFHLTDETKVTGNGQLDNFQTVTMDDNVGAAYIGVDQSESGPIFDNEPGGVVLVGGTASITIWPGFVAWNYGTYSVAGQGSKIILGGDTRFAGGSKVSGPGTCVVGTQAQLSDGVTLNHTNANKAPVVVSQATLELNGGTIRSVLSSPSASHVNLQFSDGSTFLWEGGTVGRLVENTVVFDSGSILSLSGDSEKVLNATLKNNGEARWIGKASVAGLGSFYNYGTLTISGDAGWSAGLFYNYGSVRKTESNGESVIGAFVSYASSKVSVDSGQLTLQGGILVSSLQGTAFNVAQDEAKLQISGDFKMTLPGNTFSTTPNSLVDFRNARIEMDSGSSIALLQGNLQFSGDLIFTPTNLVAQEIKLSSGTKFYWAGGNLENVTVENNGAQEIRGNAGQGLKNSTVQNNGSIDVQGSFDAKSCQIVNSGTLEFSHDADFTGDGNTILKNLGAMTVSPGVTVHLSNPTDNLGTIDLQGTVFSIPKIVMDSGVINLNPGGGLVSDVDLNGGALTGSTTFGKPIGVYELIDGNILNNSLGKGVSPGNSPGLLHVLGNYTCTSNATLTIELAGLTPGTQFDQFLVNGQARLDGSLNVKLLNSYRPMPGDRFEIMTFASSTGKFAVKNGLNLGSGLVLLPVYGPTNVTLVATNATLIMPSTTLLPAATAGDFRLSWNGVAGVLYQVERSSDLVHWFALAQVTGTDATLSYPLTQPVANSPMGFFRLTSP